MSIVGDRPADLLATKRRSAPHNRDLTWKEAFASAQRLTPLRHRRFSHSQQLGLDGLIARVRSIAFVASLPPAEREGLLERVREIARSHPGPRRRRPAGAALPHRRLLVPEA